MMRKVVLIVIALLLLACTLGALCACESFKATPIVPAGVSGPVESNGGLVVKQGKYLYFVNGYVGTSTLEESGKANWFGEVTKGAIVRVTYKEDGTLDTDYTVIVPKTVTAETSYAGFSIYGDWIYYVSPSAEEDRSGAVQVDTLQFMRTKLNGTGTQVIMSLEDASSVAYKYTASALLWYDSTDGTLYSKPLNVKRFKAKDKGDVIEKEVSGYTFIKNPKYNPNASTIADYVLYTKASELSMDKSNTLYISDPLGAKKTALIGAKSYADKKYNVKVLATDVRAGVLTVYYTKTYYPGISSSGETEGTFAYSFDKDFVFDASKEVKLADTELSDLFPIEGGVVTTGSNAAIYYLNGDPKKSFGDLNLNEKLIAIENGYFYYVKDSKLMFFKTDDLSNAHYVYTSDDKIADNSSFAGTEYYDGYVYFIQDDDYKYLARVKLATLDNFYASTEPTVERVAKITADDQKKMDEAEKESSEEK